MLRILNTLFNGIDRYRLESLSVLFLLFGWLVDLTAFFIFIFFPQICTCKKKKKKNCKGGNNYGLIVFQCYPKDRGHFQSFKDNSMS